MTFDDISNYSYDVADKANSFKTLGQLKIEKQEKEVQ
jgi:hypothetical protein